MNKTTKSIFILLTLLLYPGILFAQPNAPREQGISGDALFGIGYINSDSFLSTSNEDPIDDLQGNTPSGSTVIPTIIGRVTYTFEDTNQQAFLGINRQKAVRGSFSPEIGYRFHTGQYQFFEVAVLPGIQSSGVWEDPYLTGEKRRETDSNLRAIRARAEHLWGPLSLEVAYGTSKIDQEQSGIFENLRPDELASLDRNSTVRYLGADLTVPLGGGFILLPSLFNYRNDADGDAMSFDTYGGELGLVYSMGRHTIIGVLSYEQLDYDAANPIFSSEREDKVSNLFAIYSFSEPFSFEDTTFTIILSDGIRKSDIGFFEEENFLLGGGIQFIF